MITVETLQSLKVCGEGIKTFSQIFPNGTNQWEDIYNHKDCPSDYKGWIASHAPDLTFDQRKELIQSSNDPKVWSGRVARFVPDLTFDQRNVLIQSSNDPKVWSGNVATNTPNLTPKERKTLRNLYK